MAVSGDDQITVTGTGANNSTVAVNDQPTLTFNGFPTLDVSGAEGDDKIDIVPTGAWGVTTNVDGGPSIKGDTLLVNGFLAGADTVAVTPSGT